MTIKPCKECGKGKLQPVACGYACAVLWNVQCGCFVTITNFETKAEAVEAWNEGRVTSKEAFRSDPNEPDNWTGD